MFEPEFFFIVILVEYILFYFSFLTEKSEGIFPFLAYFHNAEAEYGWDKYFFCFLYYWKRENKEREKK